MPSSFHFLFQDYRAGKNEETARSAVSYLIINVTDVDDQPAVFTQNLYKVTLPESLARVSQACQRFVYRVGSLRQVFKRGMVIFQVHWEDSIQDHS